MKILSLKKIITTIILFVLFYALFVAYSDIDKIKENYQQIKPIYLLPMIGILTFSIFLRSLLQRFLLQKIGINLSIKQSFFLFWSGLSMLITPGGSGQMIKSHYIQKMYGQQLSKSLPLVFAERFYDFLALVLIVCVSIFFFIQLETLIIVTISTVLLIGVFLAIKNTKFLNMVKSVAGKIPFFKKTLSQISQFDDSLQKLFETKIIVQGCMMAVMAFFLEGFVIYLGFLTFDINFDYLQTVQIFYTSVLFGTLSLIPGGVGVLEGTFVNIMIQKNFELSLITSLIILIRLTTTWYATFTGFVVLYITIVRKKIYEN